MNAEVRHIFNTEQIDQAVAAAMVGWKAKHPGASEQDALHAETDIRTAMIASRTKDKFLNSKANRAARRAHIDAEINRLDVATCTVQEYIAIDVTEESLGLPSNMPIHNALLIEAMRAAGVMQPVQRPVQFVYKLRKNSNGLTYIDYALSAKNPYDDEDRLVGLEYAVARFAAGKIDTVVVKTKTLKEVSVRTIFEKGLDGEVSIVDIYLGSNK